MSDDIDLDEHIRLHALWAKPFFDQPIRWSKRARLRAWLRRKPLPVITGREALELYKKQMALTMRYAREDE